MRAAAGAPRGPSRHEWYPCLGGIKWAVGCWARVHYDGWNGRINGRDARRWIEPTVQARMAPLPAGYSWGSEGSIAAARVTRQSGARPASATSAPRAASIWRPPPPPRLEPWTPPPTTDEGGSGGGGVGEGGRGQHAATSNDSTFGARHAPDKVGLARSDAQRSQLAADRLAERMARQQLEVFERESARSREALSAFLNSRRDRRQVQALHTTMETAEAANLRAASQMLVVDLRTKLAGLVAGTGTIECGRVVRERESRARSREECS